MPSHYLYELGNDYHSCSCGERFSSGLAALDHALPLNTRILADATAADPKSSPELIARAETLAQEAGRISRREPSA